MITTRFYFNRFFQELQKKKKKKLVFLVAKNPQNILNDDFKY